MKKAALLALALSLALTGCSPGLTIFSNYRHLEMIELVRTVTVDSSEDGVLVGIYGTAGEEQEARMYEKSGPSIGVTMNPISSMWPHSRILCSASGLSTEMAFPLGSVS